MFENYYLARENLFLFNANDISSIVDCLKKKKKKNRESIKINFVVIITRESAINNLW